MILNNNLKLFLSLSDKLILKRSTHGRLDIFSEKKMMFVTSCDGDAV
ncbi:hypothetical protein HMPREF3220_02326 [Citrobacter koseri]|nr:hypothetical protein HMPREF3220_02326 [Citrobacter koseri]KXA04426.1 hypothetical protein HMPREF3207_01411 [Citrobacter koseri]